MGQGASKKDERKKRQDEMKSWIKDRQVIRKARKEMREEQAVEYKAIVKEESPAGCARFFASCCPSRSDQERQKLDPRKSRQSYR